METFLTWAIVLGGLGIGAIWMFGDSTPTTGQTAEFKAKASEVDRAVARSVAAIPWTTPTIAASLPLDAEGDPIRPTLAGIDYHPRGAEVRWEFGAGFGVAHWERIWPDVEGYIEGDGQATIEALSRSGVTVLVVSREALDGSRGPSWME